MSQAKCSVDSVCSVSTQTEITGPDLSLILFLNGRRRCRWCEGRCSAGSHPYTPEEPQLRSRGVAASGEGAALHGDCWPLLPPKYYTTLAENYGRQSYRSKSYKYGVNALQCDVEIMSAWARHRFGLFMYERGLHELWAYARHGELPCSRARGTTFEKYDFRGRQLEIESEVAEVVYHGTYPECFCRTSYCGLQDSSQHNGLGHDCRTRFDALFTADSMQHAMRYAWPANFLQDNLYYGLLFELVIDKRQVLQRRNGEVLVSAKSVCIRSVYLLTNLGISHGGEKCAVWDPGLELLPECLKRRRGQHLTSHPVRKTAWHN